MRIISWDVGVIHLAYCVLDYDDNGMAKIIDWDEINLLDDRIELTCDGEMKSGKTCGKKATYCLKLLDDSMVGFCKTHLDQWDDYWSDDLTVKLFRKHSKNSPCTFIKKNQESCGKNSKYTLKLDGADQEFYCTAHFKSELNKKLNDLNPKPIRNLIVKKYPTDKLQLSLINKLDALSEHFAKLQIEEVIIENQPSQKNPKMKSISNTLFDFFLIRGYIDKVHNLDIKLVRFICPSNKLKINNDNTIEVFKANKNSKQKYKLTKALGISYTRTLLKNDKKKLKFLESHKKKDDLCDAYLQGLYYLQILRPKNQPK